MLFMLLFSVAAAENLLENGSFESVNGDGMPLAWETDAYVLDEGYSVFSVSEDSPKDGLRCARIRNNGMNDARLAQTVRVEPETLYRFSGYIRAKGIKEGRGANLSLEGLYVFSESVYDSNNEWVYIEWYGETGEGQETVTLFARLGGYSGESTGEAWFDQLSLEPVAETPGNVIADRWYSEKNISRYDDDTEAEEDVASASPAWPRLIMIAVFYSVLAVLILQQLRRKHPALRPEAVISSSVWFSAGLVLAFLLRLALSWFIPGYMVDVNCFRSWGETMANHGPAGFYPETNFCDYPPAYTWVLGLNALICRIIPNAPSGWPRLVFRFVPALCDLLSCVLLDRFARRRFPSLSETKIRVALLVLAFNPLTIMNSAAWGQMDSVLALFLLMVAIWAIEGKWIIALPCYMLSVLIKPQALMLGFLGLAALLVAWFRDRDCRKKILTGLGAAAIVFLIIVVPFSLRQDPFWIISQYSGTLASYPYATVNTANFYYLFNGNWDSISHTANLWAPISLAVLCGIYGLYWTMKARRNQQNIWIEQVLTALFICWFVYCALSSATWNAVGIGAMAFAFVIVLSLFLRKEDISFLPYLGGLLFLILYVFGIKMHERYVFPAVLLFSLAFLLHRDRRIATILLCLTLTAFINEGIVLDNSIRLGSARGHLNEDTVFLADLLSILNILNTLYAVHVGTLLCLSEGSKEKDKKWIRESSMDGRLHWQKKDSAALAVILSLYSVLCFSTLGSTRAPQTAWTSSEYPESVTLDLGSYQDGFDMLYFARVSRYNFSVAVSDDGVSWRDETWAEMDQGQCWKWKYVTNSTQNADGTRSFDSSRHWFSGRYVRITAHQVGLSLCEVIFRDNQGKILPVFAVDHQGGDPESVLYSPHAAALLVDEQNSMEGLPVWFPVSEDELGDETDPRTPQPSWWNSTYFDEIYHARTGWEFLQGASPYETSHPPLGKIFISGGIALFGMTPFGWRFAGAFAGVCMLAGVYLLVRQLTGRTALSVLGAGLMALDCMHFTQTQIATIDSYPVLFILFSYFFMLRFLQTDWRFAPKRKVLADLGCSGLFMGLAIASKWIGIYAGAGLAILFFWHGARLLLLERHERLAGTTLERKNTASSALQSFLGFCIWCVLFFVLIPSLIYLLSYVPYFAHRHFTSLKDYLNAVWQSQIGMLNYHSTPGLGMDHPFYSPWYEWPVMAKPMFYSTKQYIFSDRFSFSIFCFGNPAIWFPAIGTMLLCGWGWLKAREQRLQDPSLTRPETGGTVETNLLFLLVGFLAQYLPWTLVPRGTYIYHYFASIPFLVASLTLVWQQFLIRRYRWVKAGMGVYLMIAALAFCLFFPYVSGIMSPVGWLNIGRGLLKIWY